MLIWMEKAIDILATVMRARVKLNKMKFVEALHSFADFFVAPLILSAVRFECALETFPGRCPALYGKASHSKVRFLSNK
ncbi:MAG: hypothetical protein A3E79_19370 [Burkholderiales bacterium RIFCSPHIGHO2_12_FULL_61_11]|nr:MAG: hypothetical protein A3E79_19370 [Burkholderiales bacterium RIFCSPHIGHO2_12_FULL_61_11]